MFMKKLIFSLIPVILLAACINGDKYDSKMDAGIFIEHSKIVEVSENKPVLKLGRRRMEYIML